MEFGPRSLGARSILADPRHPGMRDRINALVKKRESFRPFAPAVLDYKAKDHFDLDHDSPFMLETCQVTSRLSLPAITHVDGSARVQTIHKNTNQRFYDLLTAFDRFDRLSDLTQYILQRKRRTDRLHPGRCDQMFYHLGYRLSRYRRFCYRCGRE